MPLFKRKQKTIPEEEDLAAAEEVAPAAPKKEREIDEPDDSWALQDQSKLLATHVEDFVVVESCQGSQLIVSAWKPKVGRLVTQKVRTGIHDWTGKCSALVMWCKTVYVGCYDGAIYRCDVLDKPGTVLIPRRETDPLVEVMCACGQPDTPEPELIAAGTALGSIYLYRIPSGEKVVHLEAHKRAVKSLVYAANSRTLLSIGDEDGRVLCWREQESGWSVAREITSFLRFGCKVSRMAFDNESLSLGVGDSEGNLHLWHPCESFTADADLPPPKSASTELTAISHIAGHGSDFVCTDANKISVIDVVTGSIVRSFVRPEKLTIANLTVMPSAFFTLEPDSFPKCNIRTFSLPPRRLTQQPTRSASTSSSPVPPQNASFGAGPKLKNTSFGGRSAGTVSPVPIAGQPKARSRASLGSSGPPERSGSARAVSPVVRPPSGPPASRQEAPKSHKTQASIDFDDFVTNRSVVKPGSEARFPFSQGSFDAPVVQGAEDLFSAGTTSQFGANKSGSGSTAEGSTAFSTQAQRGSESTRQAPRPGGGGGPAAFGRQVSNADTVDQSDRMRALERAFELLGGIAQLEKLKQAASQSEDFCKAREIKEVVDALTAEGTKPVVPAFSFGAGPSTSSSTASAPQFTPVVPVTAVNDPLADFFASTTSK